LIGTTTQQYLKKKMVLRTVRGRKIGRKKNKKIEETKCEDKISF
jgi:hypothetical protein